MRASVVSARRRVTATTSAPWPLMVPANTSSPSAFSTGIDSPVIGAWLTSERPVLHHAVEGDAVARPHDHQRARRHEIERDAALARIVTHQHVGRHEVEQPADRLARAIEALRLEPLRRGKQRDHHRGFVPFADGNGANHGDHHQRVDIETALAKGLHRALGGKHGADEGGGDKQRRAPPRPRRQRAEGAADDDEARGGCGKPSAHARAGRRRRMVFAVVAADGIDPRRGGTCRHRARPPAALVFRGARSPAPGARSSSTC